MNKKRLKRMSLLIGGMALCAAYAGALPACAEEDVTLTFLSHYQEEGKKAWVEYCKEVLEEKYPNITLNIETVGADSYDTVLQTKLASDDAPAIFDLKDNYEIGIYKEAGHLADLSGQPCLELVDPALLSAGQLDGVQYGVPIETSGYGVFYNEEIFEQYGLEEPATLSELRAVCETLTENGIQPFAAPFAEQWAFQYYLRVFVDSVCVQENHDWYADKMSHTSSFSDDEAFKQCLEDYFSFHEYWGDDPFGTSWEDAQSMVASGEAAMCIHGSWSVDGFLSHNPDCKIAVFPMPVSEDPADPVIIKEIGKQFVLYASEDEAVMEAAYNLFNTVYSVECMGAYAEEAHQMPSIPGDYEMLPALRKIADYPAENCFVETGVTVFKTEYQDVYLELLANASMGDTLDADSLCADLDAAFAALE